MRVTVPGDATQTKGAVQLNPQEDVYLLSFVTSGKNAEGIAADLHAKEPLKAMKKNFAPEGQRFGHLGLPEPQLLAGTRWAGASGCSGSRSTSSPSSPTGRGSTCRLSEVRRLWPGLRKNQWPGPGPAH
jgi:hypothetical protein